MALKAFLCLSSHLCSWQMALSQTRAFQEQKTVLWSILKPTFLFSQFSLNKKNLLHLRLNESHLTLPSFDLLLWHKTLDLVLIACSSLDRLKQPLLSLQLKDQSESQRAPASPFPSRLFLRVSWLPRHQLPLQACGYVALPNISIQGVIGTCFCLVLQCTERRQRLVQERAQCSPCPSHHTCPCSCKHGHLGEAENPCCPQHWQHEYRWLFAPTVLDRVCLVTTAL